MSNLDNQNIPYDISYLGTDQSGRLDELFGKEALDNAIIQWIQSFGNELLRRPGRGGKVTQWFNSNMDDETARSIEHSIRDGVETDFLPPLILQYVKVEPDYENKAWLIQMEVFCPSLQLSTAINEKFRNVYED